MAITARLGVDFGPFFDAVQKANITLKGFEAGAGDVSKKLDQMANSFSGQKVFQQATLAQKAIEDIGGASQLTAKEQQRLNGILDEALQKYTAIGVKAPAGMQDLYNATKKVSTATESWGSQVNSLMGALGVGLSVGGVVAFAKSLLEMGDNLVRVADRTGLTTVEVQKLQFIAGQSGNTIDELAAAIGKLQKNLTLGDGGAVKAVEQLGLNLETLKAESPYQQMADVASAIQKIDDPAQRATLAIQLFGKAGAAILPSLIANFQQLGDEAPTMSDKTVRALDAAGDSLNKFGLQVKVWAAEVYNLAGNVFDRITAFAIKTASSILGAVTTFLEIEQKIPGVTSVFNKLGISTQGLRDYQQQLTDQSKLLVDHLSDQEVAIRKNTGAITDFEPAVEKATRATADHTRAVKEQKYEMVGIGDVGEHLIRVMTDYNQSVLQHQYELLERLIPATKDWNSLLAITPGDIIETTAALTDFNNIGQKVAIETLPGMITGTGIASFSLTDLATRVGQVGAVLNGVQGEWADFAKIGINALQGVASALAKGDVFGAIVAGATAAVAVVAKLWDKLRDLFGGPSKDELAAREEFGKSFDSANQALDVLGKKFADAGIDGETARVMIQALFDATHVSAKAVDDAMTAINDRIAQGAGTAANAVDDVTKNIDELNRAVAQIPTNPYSDWNVPGGVTDASYGSSGGMVTASGIQHFSHGGRVLPFRGMDTVPAMLTPGEMVLTRAQQQAAFSASGPTTIVVQSVLDGRVIAESTTSYQNRRDQLRRKVRAA